MGDEEAVVNGTVDHVQHIVAVEVGPEFTAGDAVFEDLFGGGATGCLDVRFDLGGQFALVLGLSHDRGDEQAVRAPR